MVRLIDEYEKNVLVFYSLLWYKYCMIHGLLIIILAPLALVSIVIMSIIGMYIWKYVLAILLWIAALLAYALYQDAVWAIILGIVGCGFWVSDSVKDDKPVH